MARIVFSLLLLVLYLAPQPVLAQEQGLLWRITTPQQTSPSYLFGTIHSEDPRVLALPKVVQQALDHSSRFVMELVPDEALSTQLSQHMMLPPSQQLAGLLDPKLHSQVMELLAQQGIPAKSGERMKPWAVTMLLSMPTPRSGRFLDEVLHEEAVSSGKQIGSLETIDEQIEPLDDLSMPQQIELLRNAVEHYAELPADTEALIAAWLKRDLAALQRLGEESNEGLPKELDQLLQSRLIDQRNLHMAQRIAPMVKEGGVFVAVGALHLPGPQGVIALLRQQGFTVTPVY